MPDYLRWLRRQVGPALLPLAYATAIVQDAAGRERVEAVLRAGIAA